MTSSLLRAQAFRSHLYVRSRIKLVACASTRTSAFAESHPRLFLGAKKRASKQGVLIRDGVCCVSVHCKSQSTDAAVYKSTFDKFRSYYSPSLLESLEIDPESDEHFPNRVSRQVRSGHYVLVQPTPIPKPQLVATSPALFDELGIKPEDVDDRFVAIFSGDGASVAKPGNKQYCAGRLCVCVCKRQCAVGK